MGTFLQVLPLELRLQIYRELLVAKKAVTAPGARPKPKSPGRSGALRLTFILKPQKQLHPAILRVCKQTYAEASFILLKENHFYYNDVKHVMMLENDQYATQALAGIKHIHLAFELIEETPNILQYMIDQGWSLETLSSSFDFASTSHLSNFERIELEYTLEEKFPNDGSEGDLTDDKFYDLMAELHIHKKLEISVRSSQEKWCAPVEDFAATIGTEREWSSVLTNSEFLPKKRKNQHGRSVSESSSDAIDFDDGKQQGIWKRTWTLKPVNPDQS